MQVNDSAIHYFSIFCNKNFKLLILVGLLLRIATAFFYGTSDVEWWKAWGTYSVQNNLTSIYGGKDEKILQLIKEGKSREEIRSQTQTVIHFLPYQYSQTEYHLTQPPLYLYSLYLSTLAYRQVSPSLENNRIFNFFLNLQPILFSLLLSCLLAWFALKYFSPNLSRLAFVAYWLNPVVLLNSPIQGYMDPIPAFFIACSIAFLYEKRLTYSYVFLLLALLTKPQGVLVAPVVFWVGITEHSAYKNIKAIAITAFISTLIFLPFIINSSILGAIQGILSVTDSSHDLSRQSMNPWWISQYVLHAVDVLHTGKTSFIAAILGGQSCSWGNDIPAQVLSQYIGFNVQWISLLSLSLFTMINLKFVSKNLVNDRNTIFIASALQVYGYFILRVGVQVNHYFMLIPILSFLFFASQRYWIIYPIVSSVFFVQDLIFYGFGRDWSRFIEILSLTYMGWTTNLLALANTLLFLAICRHFYAKVFFYNHPG